MFSLVVFIITITLFGFAVRYINIIKNNVNDSEHDKTVKKAVALLLLAGLSCILFLLIKI